MAMAYVLITTNIGAEDKVLNEVRSMPEAKEAHVVYGVYDIIVLLEAESMANLKEIVSRKIRGLEDIRSTLTMIVVGY